MRKCDADLKSKQFFDWLEDYNMKAVLSFRTNNYSEIDTLLKALNDDGFLVNRILDISLREIRSEFIWAAFAALSKAKGRFQEQETRRLYEEHFKVEGLKLKKALNKFLQAMPVVDTECKDLIDAEFHSKILPPELRDSFILSKLALDTYSRNLMTNRALRPAVWLGNYFAQNIDHKWNEIVNTNVNGSIRRKHELALALWRLMDFPVDDDRDRDANDEDWMRARFRAIGNLPPEN